MTYERIVAVYDQASKARDAARALEASGFPPGDVSVTHRNSLNMAELREPKLWRKLFGREVTDSESTVFSRTIEGGGGVLVLRAANTEIPRAMKILDVHESDNVHDLVKARDHGGYDEVDVSSRGETGGRMDSAGQMANSALPLTGTSAAPTTAETSRTQSTAGPDREEVLRLHEEQMDVGKRVVEIGKARVRRFVVEKPVESQIKLHEEHATIQRRPVSSSSSDKDIDWSDKTFEITETAEQPVITKKARVADEVVIRREGSDHVETVRDTVRRQDIELERPNRDRDIRDRDLKRAG